MSVCRKETLDLTLLVYPADIDVFRKMNRPSKQAQVTVSADEPASTTATTSSIAAVPDQVVAETFHKELLETCIDMLLRYTYFHSSSLPKRFVSTCLDAF